MLSVFKLIVGAAHLVSNFVARDIKNPIFVFKSVDRRQSFPTVIDKCLFEGTFKFITQSFFNKVGHLLNCKQSKRGWEPQIFYSYIVMSQLHETKI
jgi:hypothetical protein